MADVNRSQDKHPESRLLAAVLWQRLDQPAFELCRLWQHADTFRLEGTVLISTEGMPAEVHYDVLCNGEWATQSARVAVTRGPSTRTVAVRRDENDRWWRNGAILEELAGTRDIDLGFTPATNTLPIRRLSLEVGASASVDAAWLRFPDLGLEVLPQRYTRLDAVRYRYESAGGTFVAELQVDELGIVVRYGNLWKRVGEWPAADNS